MILVPTLLASGCYVTDDAQYGGNVTASADGNAELVELSPGVEVVADYGQPIFFADDYYWWFNGGFWYRSTWYGGGWGRARNIPPQVTGIRDPGHYAHYRPEGWAHEGNANRVEAHGAIRGTGARAPTHVAVRSRPAPRGGGRHR